MWKFEVQNDDGSKNYHIMEQNINSDVAKFVPEITGAPREKIKIFFLERNAYLEAKELLKEKDKYQVLHLENGDCQINLKSDKSWIMTVPALEKKWGEIYQENEHGDEIYMVKE